MLATKRSNSNVCISKINYERRDEKHIPILPVLFTHSQNFSQREGNIWRFYSYCLPIKEKYLPSHIDSIDVLVRINRKTEHVLHSQSNAINNKVNVLIVNVPVVHSRYKQQFGATKSGVYIQSVPFLHSPSRITFLRKWRERTVYLMEFLHLFVYVEILFWCNHAWRRYFTLVSIIITLPFRTNNSKFKAKNEGLFWIWSWAVTIPLGRVPTWYKSSKVHYLWYGRFRLSLPIFDAFPHIPVCYTPKRDVSSFFSFQQVWHFLSLRNPMFQKS